MCYMSRVTVKPMRGRGRIACGAVEGTVRFVRCWHVYRDGERDDMLFVGEHESGEMYGVQGAQIRLRMHFTKAHDIAQRLVTIVDHLARERQS